MGRSAPEAIPDSGIDVNAPAAPSGAGYFREAFPANSGSISTRSPAYRISPVNASLVAQASSTPVSTGGKKPAKTKKPPKTKVLTKSVKKESTSETDIDVKVRVVADSTSSKVAKKGASTSYSFTNVTYKFPDISYDQKTKKITKLKNKFQFKGAIKIQTLYGKKAKASDKSLYGRGTTNKDKLAGTISLGFHESCHREDFLAYLKNNPLPTFTIKVGDTLQQYQDAISKFKTAYAKYTTDMDAKSKKNTDEVGYKLSKCKADKKCK